ncbi:solute carrier family 25 member 40-like isoform X2 [Zootermopsis nevadensis]|uniref:solute carrier family 25 member 40-like isoform X2 n=1 Tax=Zootermopsis nevadensis TaxID=136037 RepID=UPI000B8E2410|nr:solute carrier family 25 member 40-like isoform X2 [Zootermopsis nevadensis]
MQKYERECQILDDPRFRISMAQQMAAACSGALITSFLMTPFDVVKIRLQTQQKKLLSNKCFLYCNGLMDHLCPCINPNGPGQPSSQTSQLWYHRRSHFTGTIDAFVKIARNEGSLSLWSGLSPTLVLAVPATVVYFVTYENLRLLIKDRHNGIQPHWGPLVAGATARVWSVTLVSPLELIRTKMQSKKVSYQEMCQALKTMLHYHGVRGLFKGLSSTLLRDVPFSGIYWLHYEKIKSILSPGVPSFGVSFFSGAVAGSIAAVATTPFDVVKTHQQIELGEKEIYSEPPGRSSSMLKTLQNIYSRNGISGLFTGLAPRLVKVAPACAIMISTFEYGKFFFHRYNHNHYKSVSSL